MKNLIKKLFKKFTEDEFIIRKECINGEVRYIAYEIVWYGEQIVFGPYGSSREGTIEFLKEYSRKRKLNKIISEEKIIL